ncbi:RND transporter, partial [Acinetobacter pittii]|nr:RND transporter [Acinetobacter pittii]
SSIVQYIAATGRSRQAYDLNNISIQGFEVQP